MRVVLHKPLHSYRYRTRDLVYRKAFKEKIGVAAQAPPDGPTVWKRLRTIPDFVYKFVMDALEKRRIKEFRERYVLGECLTVFPINTLTSKLL